VQTVDLLRPLAEKRNVELRGVNAEWNSRQNDDARTCIPGDPRRPFDEAQVANKFRQVVSWAVGARAAERLLPLALTALVWHGRYALIAFVNRPQRR